MKEPKIMNLNKTTWNVLTFLSSFKKSFLNSYLSYIYVDFQDILDGINGGVMPQIKLKALNLYNSGMRQLRGSR